MKHVKNIRIWKDKGCVVAVKLKLFENLQHFGRFASCYERQPASLSVWLDWAYHSDQDMECEHRTQRMVLMPHFFGLRFLRCMTGVHRAINAIRAKDGQAADPGLGGKPDRRAAWTRTGWHAIRAIHINTRDVCNIDLERAVSACGIKTSKLSEHHFSQGKDSMLSPNVFRRTSPKVGQVFHANSDIGEYDKCSTCCLRPGQEHKRSLWNPKQLTSMIDLVCSLSSFVGESELRTSENIWEHLRTLTQHLSASLSISQHLSALTPWLTVTHRDSPWLSRSQLTFWQRCAPAVAAVAVARSSWRTTTSPQPWQPPPRRWKTTVGTLKHFETFWNIT